MEHQFLELMEELLQRNVDFGDAETLRKNLKSFKDAGRNERSKVGWLSQWKAVQKSIEI